MMLEYGAHRLDVQAGGHGIPAESMMGPPVTVAGVTTQAGWNARKFNASAGTWSAALDVGAGDPQALPFVLLGEERTMCYPDCDGNGILEINTDRGCRSVQHALFSPYADANLDGVYGTDDLTLWQEIFLWHAAHPSSLCGP